MTILNNLNVQIFADGANYQDIVEQDKLSYIKGFTTNPTLMRKSNITDYEIFSKEILSIVTDKPFSFEVFSDDFEDMERQAIKIASWGENVNVKIPITNTKGVSTKELIKKLSKSNVKLNITAIMTIDQVENILDCFNPNVESFISIFAGRIADTGIDPVNIMKKALNLLSDFPNLKLIWASPREVLNIIQADEIGCDVITVTNDILKKTNLLKYDLTKFSQDTVNMFYEDAKASKFRL